MRRLRLVELGAERWRHCSVTAIVSSSDCNAEVKAVSKKQQVDTSSPEFKARAEERRRTWSITRHASLDAMKDAEYRGWATLPDPVKFATICEVSATAFALKGIHVPRLPRPHRAPE